MENENKIAFFEIDDYPMGWLKTIPLIDELKQIQPNLKITIFAIPMLMTEEYWKPLEERKEWIHVAVHGLYHFKNECNSGIIARKLTKIIQKPDKRYIRMFKPPQYGYGMKMIKFLINEKWILSIRSKLDLICVPLRIQKWIKNAEIFIPNCRYVDISNKSIKSFHAHTGERNINDIVKRIKEYRKLFKNYTFVFSESLVCTDIEKKITLYSSSSEDSEFIERLVNVL